MDISSQIEQDNFRHLIKDVFWFGLAFPATSRFLAVYALRVGASAQEVAWLSALPALMLLAATTLSRWWSHRYPDAVRASFWSGLGFRFSFLLPVLTPFFPPEWQPAWLLFSVTLPALPQGLASVVFLVLLRQAVSANRLPALVSQRTLILNIALILGTLLLGYWLEIVPFPFNYQSMFGLAFGLGLISLWHVSRTKNLVVVSERLEEAIGISPWQDSAFRAVIVTAFLTHLTWFIVVPLVPIYLIDHLGASESFVAILIALELLAAALASLALNRFVSLRHYRLVIAPAMVCASVSTAIIALSSNLMLILAAGAINGAAWTFISLAVYGFFTQRAPDAQLTAYAAAYNQVIFLAMFVGPLLSSLALTLCSDILVGLILGAALRFLAGIALAPHHQITRWPRHGVALKG